MGDENAAAEPTDSSEIEIEQLSGVEVKDTEDATFIDGEDITPEDVLAIILSAKPVHQTMRVGIRARAGMPRVALTLRSLTDREFKLIRTQAEIPSGNRKDQRAGKKETDDSLFLRLVVATAVEEPKLGSREVLQAHKLTNPDQVVEKLFLPGTIGQIAEKVMELSGWSEDGVEEISGNF